MAPDPGIFLSAIAMPEIGLKRKEYRSEPYRSRVPPSTRMEATGAGELSSTVAVSGTYTCRTDRDHGNLRR